MNEMREKWDLRARTDAVAFIEAHREIPDLEGFFALGEHFAQVLADPVLAGVARGRALDLGSGRGRVTRALARRFEEVVAVDVSAEMVRRAEALHPKAEFPNVSFHATDGVHLPLEDESVDFVFSYEVFQHLPSRDVMCGNLLEVARVLRPEGLALVHVHRAPGAAAYWLERAQHAVPDRIWLRLKRALGRGNPLMSDVTFRGTAPLRRKDIEELWAGAGLTVTELRDDPTHEPNRRALVVARR